MQIFVAILIISFIFSKDAFGIDWYISNNCLQNVFFYNHITKNTLLTSDKKVPLKKLEYIVKFPQASIILLYQTIRLRKNVEQIQQQSK